MTYKLIIFDLDGTLAAFNSTDLLPGVLDYFNTRPLGQHVAIATNQGGVGLRYWMESAGFGDPASYPTYADVQFRLEQIQAQIPAIIPVYMCCCYKSAKSGKWSPVPSGMEGHPGWDQNCRKPAPEMLLKAMQAMGASPDETLMVGDSDEDEQAAIAAGCAFQWAGEFFKQKVSE